MKRTLITVIILAVGFLTSKAQGIQFEKSFNWDQIIDKAKSEHKYIFVDCYATWCGPCKQMDQSVYPVEKVGRYMNEHFITVKMQMDKAMGDSDSAKRWYGLAKTMESDYTINAFPTFLFFDPDGKPVHKVVGYHNAPDFIQLAKDSQNPAKQYYSVLKNFEPGKLDTAEEKGLVASFAYSDKILAGKIAADYLSRVPANEIKSIENGRLMIRFQDNPQVLNIAINYIQSNQDSLLEFEESFADQPRVQAMAKDYIDHLPEQKLYDLALMDFLSVFTNKPTDRGFDIFYHHTAKVDAITKNNYFATGAVIKVISKTEFDPLLSIAKAKAIEPDWEALSKTITVKYDARYAELVMINGKYAWFEYLVKEKKDDKYWPEYITSEIAKVEKFRYDTISVMANGINNVSYEIFKHGNYKAQLLTVADWMKYVVNNNPKDPGIIDTYACVLYKAGQKEEAIVQEERALQIATLTNKGFVPHAQTTIDKMKKDEKIWLEKEYLND